MRQALGPKKVVRIARETGLPVVRALARGGTDHWLVLVLDDGPVLRYHPRTKAFSPWDRDWPAHIAAQVMRAAAATGGEVLGEIVPP